jgi:hypothetical protein
MNRLSVKLSRLECGDGEKTHMIAGLGQFTNAEIAEIMRQVSGKTRGLPSQYKQTQ